MIRRCLLVPLAALAVALTADRAHADAWTFTYDFTPTAPAIVGDGGFNQLDLSVQPANTVSANATDIVAANITVHNGLSDTFHGGDGNGVPYTLVLKLTDGPASTQLGLTGRILGSITDGNPSLTNVFDTPVLPTFTLNGDVFMITMTGFVSPNPYNPDPSKITDGAFGLHVNILVGKGAMPEETPEPSTLLLSCLGLGGLGLRMWRRRI